MDYLFPPELQEGLVVTYQAPPHAELYMLPFADATIREGAFGSLLMQEIRREEFSINLHIFQVQELPSLKLSVEKPYAAFIYVLQGKASYTLPGMNKALLEEGAYYLCYFPAGAHSLQLETNIYMIVQIKLSPILLDKLAGTYYGMYEAHNSIIENTSEGMLLNGEWMNPRVCDILSKLIYCRLEDDMGALYQETRMRDLLLLYTEDVADKDKKEQGNFNFSSADISAILDAKDQQLRKIEATIYLKDIARNANLHPKKLQAGFKIIFGKSPTKFIAEARVEKAKILLKETDKSIKEIAYEVGFGSDSSFIQAFKRSEGITPHQYRK